MWAAERYLVSAHPSLPSMAPLWWHLLLLPTFVFVSLVDERLAVIIKGMPSSLKAIPGTKTFLRGRW